MIMMASFQPTIWKAENNDGANKDHSDEDDDEYASDENNDGGDEGQSDGDDDEYAKDENYDLEKIIRNLMRIIIMTMPKYLKQTLGSFSRSHDDRCHQT